MSATCSPGTPNIMPFTLRDLNNEKPLLHHLNHNNGIHKFMQRAFIYMFMLYLGTFLSIQMLRKDFSHRDILELPCLAFSASLIIAISLLLRFNLAFVQKHLVPSYFYVIYVISTCLSSICFYSYYQQHCEGTFEEKAPNLVTIKVTANLWFSLFITSYVQNDIK